jgi:hypothetical protein
MGGAKEPTAELRNRIEALKHPALLGCARDLNQVQRQELFRGTDAVWIELLTSYLKWFARKAFRRKGYEEDRVQAVLKAVARACEQLPPSVETYDLEEHWVKPAMSDPQLGQEMIRDVFREAISSGLVDSPGQSSYTMPSSFPVPWIWRFRFLQAHLAKLV